MKCISEKFKEYKIINKSRRKIETDKNWILRIIKQNSSFNLISEIQEEILFPLGKAIN